MASILQQLIGGQLHPRDRRVKYGSEYAEARKELDEEITHIESLLSDEDTRRLNTLLDLHTGLDAISAEESELSMFRLGALIMAEIYAGRDKLLNKK